MPITTSSPVIIAGGGIIGLTLAQALKAASIPHLIYDRDASLDRAAGWGITIHWALPALQSCLPPALLDRLSTIQVDPQQGIKDTGRFLFLDLETAEPKWIIPPSKRLRVSRRKFRELLAEGLDVQWGKSLESFELLDATTASESGVRVRFSDGTVTEGCMLIGADGSNSRTRRLLLGEDRGKLNELPVKFIGTTVKMSPEQIKPMLDIDPLLFQGCHAETGTFLWFSILSTPEVNGSAGSASAHYEAQLNLSWIAKTSADEVPVGDEARLQKMKALARKFEGRLRRAIEEIPEGSQILEIQLKDWPTEVWDSHGGRVTLVGDAGHAMTMYRGEAANHGLRSASLLATQLISVHNNTSTLASAISVYEAELRDRGHDAVLLSRQACLDAHDLQAITKDSPVVSRRTRVLKPGEEVVG